MPWYVVLETTPSAGTGNVTAIVQQYADAAAFQKATGTTPSNTGVPGETDAGYPSQAAAQAVADAYNKSGSGKGATGAAPYNDYIGAGTPGPVANPLAALAGIARAMADIGGFLIHAWKVITNWRMWASLGWLVLGVAIFLAGISLYLTGDVNPVAGAKSLAAGFL